MAPLIKKEEISEQQKKLFKELDKGIDDMEKGNMLTHEEAMKRIRQRIKPYAV